MKMSSLSSIWSGNRSKQHSIFYFCFALFILSTSSQPKIVTWNDGHNHCSFILPGHQHLSSYQNVQGEGQWITRIPPMSTTLSSTPLSPTKNRHSKQKHIQCRPKAYYSYFQEFLKPSDSTSSSFFLLSTSKIPHKEWYDNVAHEILQLYTVLPTRLHPTVLSASYVTKHYPAYSTLHQQNPNYYPTDNLSIYPLYFGLPSENVVTEVPLKSKAFGRVIPGDRSTYYNLYEESLYVDDLTSSLFVFTWKKAGWDCLRHYEILARGALPLFLDIAQCPKEALTIHPKRLYQLLLSTPGLTLNMKPIPGKMTYSIDHISYDHLVTSLSNEGMSDEKQEWKLQHATFMQYVQSALLHYAQQTMTTTAMARYVLSTVRQNMKTWYPDLLNTAGKDRNDTRISTAWPRSIFYLTHKSTWDMDKGDYQTDFLLHGLLALLGPYQSLPMSNTAFTGVLDFPSRDCLYKRDAHFNQSLYFQQHADQYGMGYSFGLHKESLTSTIDRNVSAIKDLLQRSSIRKEHKDDMGTNYPDLDSFDLVILGSLHREGWSAELYLWEQYICKHFHRGKVVLIDGDDSPVAKSRLTKFLPCAAHVFAREGYIIGQSDQK